MNELSIVMIARNENFMFEQFLIKFLDYGVPLIIVDMNSNAETLQIYEKFACDRLKVVGYDPDNLIKFGYAHPRNFGAKFVSTPWILSLDADEYIKLEDFNEVLSTLNTVTNPCISVAINNYNHSDLSLHNYEKIIEVATCDVERHRRIYRNLPNILWEGYIHEEIYIDGRSAYFDNFESSCIIHHFTKYRLNFDPKSKSERYSWMILNAKVNTELQFGTNPYWFNKHIINNHGFLLDNAKKYAEENGLRVFLKSDLNI